MKLEVKYNLPKTGQQLTRLAAQVNGRQCQMVGQQWLESAPATASHSPGRATGAWCKLFQSGIQVWNGDLLTYLKLIFSVVK